MSSGAAVREVTTGATRSRRRALLARAGALALAASLAASLAACSTEDGPDVTVGWSPDKLYAEAKDEMSSGRYASAIKYLEKLQSRYPFGRWAQQAEIDIAYCHFKDNEQAQALAALDRFIKQHPNHPALDYVYYLKGLVNFNDQQGFLASWGQQDLSERDLRASRDAFDAFKEVTTRFPESKYAEDSRDRMRYLVNSLASGETHIARYYFRRKAYIAAANRAQNVVRAYPQTPAIEEAMYILYKSYEALGLEDMRSDAERVFKLNFPDSALPQSGVLTAQKTWWKFWQ
jgi:outer membrane protein assembly factor BamD